MGTQERVAVQFLCQRCRQSGAIIAAHGQGLLMALPKGSVGGVDMPREDGI